MERGGSLAEQTRLGHPEKDLAVGWQLERRRTQPEKERSGSNQQQRRLEWEEGREVCELSSQQLLPPSLSKLEKRLIIVDDFGSVQRRRNPTAPLNSQPRLNLHLHLRPPKQPPPTIPTPLRLPHPSETLSDHHDLLGLPTRNPIPREEEQAPSLLPQASSRDNRRSASRAPLELQLLEDRTRPSQEDVVGDPTQHLYPP